MRLTPRTYREHSGLERIVKFKLRHYQTETLPVFVIKSGIRPERPLEPLTLIVKSQLTVSFDYATAWSAAQAPLPHA